MSLVNKPLFSGVYAASLTPMHPDFSCNDEVLTSHCLDLMNRGCTGIVLFGTTGEGSLFNVEERKAALRAVIKRGVDPQRLILAISCSAIHDVVELCLEAIRSRCSGVLVVPPFFYKNVEESGVIAFYREVIQKVGDPALKLFLYHIPKFSGVPITLPIIKALHHEFPHTVMGIKESDGNLSFTKEILSQFPGFIVFVGNELQLSDAVQAGAAGTICGMANAYPELIRSLYEYGKDRTQPDLNDAAIRLVQAIKKYPLVPALKSLLERHKGPDWRVLRPPLTPLSPEQSQALMKDLR